MLGVHTFVACSGRPIARRKHSFTPWKRGTASAFRADVSKADDCAAMVQAAVERYGRLDILDNNVGVSVRADVPEVTEEQLWPDGGASHGRDAAVEAVNEGLADLSAGRVMSLDQLKARLARRRAERGRARRKVA